MFLALFASTSVIQVVQADDPRRRTRATPAPCTTSTGAARLDHRQRIGDRDIRALRRRVQLAARLHRRPTCGRRSPATSTRRWAQPTGIEQVDEPGRSAAPPSSQFLDAHRAHPHGSAAARVERRADAGCRRPAAACDALGDLQGAVIAIEPATGRVLAMVSKPELRHEPARRPRHGRRSTRTTTRWSPTRAIRCSTARSAAT